MTRKLPVLSLILSLAALALAIAAVCPRPQEPRDIQYVLYLGTNGKDTNEPVFTPEEARSNADEILTRHFGGFTMQEAVGGWRNDDGTMAHEYTLVILLSDTTPEAVHAACDELLAAFDQSTVLIQENETKTEFYSGGK